MIDYIDNAFPDIQRLIEVVGQHNDLQPDDQPYYTDRLQQAIEYEPLRLFFEAYAQRTYDRIVKTYGIIDGNRHMHVDEITHAKYPIGSALDMHFDGYNWKAGYRVMTLLLYLSDEVEGGATYFPMQNIKIHPKQNRLVIFPTHFWAPHESQVVTKGCKEIVQAWAYYYLD